MVEALLAVLMAANPAVAPSIEQGGRRVFRPRASYGSTSFTGVEGVAAAAGPLFSLLATGSTDQSSTADLCDTYASSMTGNYFCLRGDGTSTGQTLTATGSPTTETRSYCGNGSSCGNVTGQRLNGSNQWYSTSALGSPTGDFTCGVTFTMTTFGGLINKGTGVNGVVRIFTEGGNRIRAQIFKTGGGTQTLVDTAAGSISARARHHATVRYTAGADGSSILRVFVDGVSSAVSTAALAPIATQTNAWTVGTDGSFPFSGTISNAFCTESALSDATILAMSNTALGKLTPATGQTLTFSRTTTKSCENTAGSEITVLPPNRPCVTQGGVSVEGAATNMTIRSEELDNTGAWGPLGNIAPAPVVTANSTDVVAPDGTFTAEKVVFGDTSGGGAAYSLLAATTVTATAAAYSNSCWMRTLSGTAITHLNFRGPSQIASPQYTVTSTWQRFKHENKALTATNTWNFDIGVHTGGPANTGQPAATIYVWGCQMELGSFASSYIATTSATVQRTAETLTAPNPLLAAGSPTTWCMGGTLAPLGAAWTSAGRGVVSVGVGGGTANTASVFTLSSGTGYFETYNSAATVKTLFTTAPVSFASHRYVGTNTSGTVTFLLDGSAPATTASGAGNGLITTQPATAYLGAVGAGQHANGLLSNIKIDSTSGGCL